MSPAACSSSQGAFSVLEKDPGLGPELVRDLKSRIDAQGVHPRIAPSAVAILARERPPGWEASLRSIARSANVDGSTRGRARRILRMAGEAEKR
jgi:hypothetical protein